VPASAGLWFALQVGVFCSLANRQTGRPARQAGFSLIEMLLVVGILGIVAAIAIPVSSTFIKQSQADGATSVALNALQDARERAIAERRNIQVNFVPPNRIRIERVEVPGPGTTLLTQVYLESLQTFRKVNGIPDTLDEFGDETPVYFTGTLPVMFTSDGSLIDANGDVVNGSVFLAGPGSSDSQRAITIMGVTGLIRTWRWSGTEWVE
jgi:prepilin-type N-terminal cleavage/methylation domain-containing protein